MNPREQDAIVRMLQDDLAGEHAAIMQYMQHVWRMGNAGGDIPCEVQEVARDEMRHFRWVAELVVDLGSDPTIERDIIYVNGSPPVDLMLLDVDAEDRAIAQYVEHVRNIDDRRVTRVIERILVDERAHREKFRGWVTELGGDPDAATPRPSVGPFSGQRANGASAQQQAAAAPESTGPFGARGPPPEQRSRVRRAAPSGRPTCNCRPATTSSSRRSTATSAASTRLSSSTCSSRSSTRAIGWAPSCRSTWRSGT